MNSQSSEEDEEPTFRIRFTISNRSDSPSNNNSGQIDHHHADDDGHANHSPFHWQNEKTGCNHQVNSEPHSSSSSGSRSSRNRNTSETRARSKQFRYIEPQNHKSALFVNLGDYADETNDNLTQHQQQQQHQYQHQHQHQQQQQRRRHRRSEKQLFISPNLNCQDQSEVDDSCETSTRCRSSSVCCKQLTKDDMSHFCSFMNWTTATRRRASSVTPSGDSTQALAAKSSSSSNTTLNSSVSTTANTENRAGSAAGDIRVALSTNDLVAGHISADLGTSSNISASVETVCGIEVEADKTQTNNGRDDRAVAERSDDQTARANSHDDNSSTISMQPIQIELDNASALSHPLSIDDILQVDLDNLRLESECKVLEEQAKYWEQKVEELERKRFAEDVPRTLVENIIKHRKELLDLELQIFKCNLDSEESDRQSYGKLSSCNLDDDDSPCGLLKLMDPQQYTQYNSASDTNRSPDGRFHEMDIDGAGLIRNKSPAVSSKYGSHLKPGQENTAIVLDAIPPTAFLQHRQYLSRASSGTDTSEYSQLPSFDVHLKHQLISEQRRQAAVCLVQGNNTDADVVQRKEQRPLYQQQHHGRHHQQQHRHRHSSARHVSRRYAYQIKAQTSDEKVGDDQVVTEAQVNQAARPRSSPIRPNHFKGDFRSAIISQDSSSTTSSSSPH